MTAAGKPITTGGKPILVVGSINLDLVANTPRIPSAGETLIGEDFQTHHGGKGANQAVAAARLGYPVQMIGRVGDDAFGDELKSGLASEGIDTSAVAVSKGSSGVAVIVVAASGENSIVVVPGANAMLTPADLEANIHTIRSAGIVLAQLEIPLATVVRLGEICARENVPLMLDPAPARELPGELLSHVTWFTPNETEAAFYAKSTESADGDSATQSATAQSLLGKGIASVALKLGARGAYLASKNGLAQSIQPFAVHAVDTTAAGDCFNGAFAVALMQGKSPEEAARFASAASAISVTRAGAQPSMPTMDEVLAMLKST
jgi:ribokinase